MARLPALKLRGRLTAALFAVSLLTLAVLAAVLLLPLDKRLRNEALASLRETARAARPTFADISSEEIRPGSPQLMREVRSLRRQTGAEVTAAASNGQVLAATDVEPGERFVDAVAAVRSNTTETDVVQREGHQQGNVAIPVDADGVRFALVLRRPLEAVIVAGNAVRQGLLVAAIVALVAALLTGVLLAGRLVRRLNRLRDAALRVAEIGPAAEVRPDDARDEVGDLTRAFATMQQQLREQEQARKTFVATASHELRTPLASLQLMLDLLIDDLERTTPDIADAREQAAHARDHSDRLGKLAAGLLDLSRLDAGLPSRRELVELGEVCRAVLAEFAPRTVDGPELVLDSPTARWAIADPGGVAQIVRILLDNAVRLSPPESAVEVRLSAPAATPEISVRDYGPGVASDDAERIFERFQRGRDAGGEAGFGLGLAIGRELAVRMDARLDLVREEVGARFVLALEPAPSAALENT